MLVRKMTLAAVLLCALSLGAIGCGSQSAIGGFGTFTLTSVAPNPVPGMIPTAITITGGDFSNLVGTDVWVTFNADGGLTPFNDGSSGSQTVPGTITSATTITTTTPRATICGPTSITAAIAVTLPSGVWMTSAPGFITFLAPVMATVVTPLGGGTLDAAVPDPVTITGSNFGDVGGTVDIFWRSVPAGAGPLLFEAGSSMTTKTTGTVTSTTTVTTTSPLALVCGAAITTQPAQIYRIDFRDGSCTPAAGPFLAVTFRAPRITGVTNAGVAPYLGTTAPALFGAAVPEPFTIAGTGFGPVGGTVTIRFTSLAGTPIYNTASSPTTTVTGTITSRTLITANESPAAAVCTVATDLQNVEVTMPDGACSPAAIDGIGAANMVGPTITGPNTNLSGRVMPFATGADFFGHIPETMQIVGTDFGPVGGTALVTFVETNAGQTPYTPAGGGPNTATSQPVLATITSRTTMELTTPLGNYTSATGNPGGFVLAGVCTFQGGTPDITAVLEGGSCNVTPFTDLNLFLGVINNTGSVAPFTHVSTIPLGETEMPEFTMTGFGFWPIGGTAEITFENPVPGAGAQFPITVTGEIIDENNILIDLPAIFPRLTVDEVADANIQLAPFGAVGTNAFCVGTHTFTAPPTITTIVNTDAAAAGFPSVFPVPFGAAFYGCDSSLMTITGTGFQLAGAPAETQTVIYDLNSGVGPRVAVPPLAPVRRIGTGAPIGVNDLGDAALYTASLTATTIAGRTRLEPLLPDLDTDNNGLVTFRVRVLNADGQFDETGGAAADPIWGTRSVEIQPGPSANIRNNQDTAIDPTSFTDDFATASADGVVGANMVLMSGDALNANLGVPAFDGSGLSVQTTLDAGESWTDASPAWTGAALSAIDVLPPGAFRNFGQCEFDSFGNLVFTYLADDVVGGSSTIGIGLSTDQGGSPAGPFIFVSTGAVFLGPGIWSEPALAVGAGGPGLAPGSQQGCAAFIDRTGFVGDTVRVLAAETVGLGVFGVAAIVTLPDAPFFGRVEPECAVGPNGETYVGWVEGVFPPVGAPFNDIRVSNDADGIFAFGFGFPAAGTIVDSVPLPFAGLAPAPDSLILGPSIDMAVAQTGTNSGRLVIAYDDIVPADFITTFSDRFLVVTKHSDDDGVTWPATPTIVHQVDTAYQFIPAIASDPTNGRFYVTWYDTQNSAPVAIIPGYDRFAAASDNGTAWGNALRLSGSLNTQAVNPPDTDFGLYAGVSAWGGHIFAGWTTFSPAGGTQDPGSAVYQQNATSSP